VEQIRGLEDKAGRDKLKAALPCITPSGEFSRRSEKDLICHSGLICLDIDYKENRHIGNFSDLKACLSRIENVAYCGLSVSGQGYFVLVPLANPEQHAAYFRALQADFAYLGIELDKACKDVSRLRGYSYDPDGYFNHQAKTYQKEEGTRGVKEKGIKGGSEVSGREKNTFSPFVPSSFTPSSSTLASLICRIEELSVDMTAGYRAWFEIGCSLANELGEGGRDCFHRVSRFHPDYNVPQTDRQFDACLHHPYRYTIATFYKYCKDHGIMADTAFPEKTASPLLPDTTPFLSQQAKDWQYLLKKHPALRDLAAGLDLEVMS
jgi:hypothetical protein